MAEHLRTCAALTASALLLLTPAPRAAAAPPPPPSVSTSATVRLVFDAGPLPVEVGDRLQIQLSGQMGPMVGYAGMRMVDSDQSSRTIRVRVVAFDSERLDYHAEIELSGEHGTSSSPPVRCEACSERRLISVVIEAAEPLVAAYGQLERQSPADAHEREPPPEPVAVAESTRPRKLGPLGSSGAVLLGAGVLGIAAGSYLLVRNVESNPSLSYVQTRNYRSPGVAALAGGAVAAGVGAVLLAVGLARDDRRHNFAMQLAPTYVGVSLHRRF